MVEENHKNNLTIIGTRKRRRGRLIALSILGMFALNYPLLSLFNKPVLMFDIPYLYFYLFSVWTLFILFVAWVLDGRISERDTRLVLEDFDDEDEE